MEETDSRALGVPPASQTPAASQTFTDRKSNATKSSGPWTEINVSQLYNSGFFHSCHFSNGTIAFPANPKSSNFHLSFFFCLTVVKRGCAKKDLRYTKTGCEEQITGIGNFKIVLCICNTDLCNAAASISASAGFTLVLLVVMGPVVKKYVDS